MVYPMLVWKLQMEMKIQIPYSIILNNLIGSDISEFQALQSLQYNLTRATVVRFCQIIIFQDNSCGALKLQGQRIFSFEFFR
jgi:hypothetical protein